MTALFASGCHSLANGKAPGNGSSGSGGSNSSGSGGSNSSSDGGSSSSSSSGGSDSTSGGDGPPPATRGATVPYWEYEAESAVTNGTILAPSRTFGDVAAEASGRQAVRLDATGQNLQFTLQHATNSIVVRYSIPDAQPGSGTDPTPATGASTLGLYVNGTRLVSLTMTSRYAWTYGTADAQDVGSNAPASGTAHHFYDETHAIFDDLPAGATIALQKDAQDTAAYYVIDLVDFEEIAAPLSQPAGSLSLTDFGAVPDDGNDDGPALQNAIDAAKTQGKVLWIPQGRFDILFTAAGVSSRHINASGVTLAGAGMWYSVLSGFGAQFKMSGNNNRMSDFALFGDLTYRDDATGYQGFDGPWGTGSRAENLWIEHTNVGFWVGHGATSPPINAPLTDGFVVHGVRVRDTWADGVNFANATANSIVEQSTFRNTGDDSLATWSFSSDGPVPCKNDLFQFNTVQTVWRANCFAIYGGQDIQVEDNLCADTSNYPGLLISTTFSPLPLTGTTAVLRNTLTRAGGPHYGQQYGALRFFADAQPLGGTVNVSDLEIADPTFAGIQFAGTNTTSGVTLDDVTVTNYQTQGIWITSEASGSATVTNVSISGTPNVGLQNDASSAFTLTRGSGNSGF